MTITDSISAQSIGTSTNIGYGKFPIKVTADSATSAFIISARLNNGAASYHENGVLRIWSTSSNFDITAAAAVTQLRQQAVPCDLRPAPNSSGVTITKTDLQVLVGGYIYCWLEISKVATAQTVDVSVIEI